MSDITIVIAGAGGRMGNAIAARALQVPGVSILGGLDHARSASIGKDLSVLCGAEPRGVFVRAFGNPIDFEVDGVKPSVVIDFSTPESSIVYAKGAAEVGIPYVVGTTGFSDLQEREIEHAAGSIPIVKSGNMSLGVNLLSALVEDAARRLPEDFDIEIIEAHHRHKVDAPSGTALLLGRAAAAGRGLDFEKSASLNRTDHRNPRASDEIGLSVIRAGGIIGDHDVMFGSEDETLVLGHRALDRGLFAKGAIEAAKWASSKRGAPGLYSMRDVLGL